MSECEHEVSGWLACSKCGQEFPVSLLIRDLRSEIADLRRQLAEAQRERDAALALTAGRLRTSGNGSTTAGCSCTSAEGVDCTFRVEWRSEP